MDSAQGMQDVDTVMTEYLAGLLKRHPAPTESTQTASTGAKSQTSGSENQQLKKLTEADLRRAGIYLRFYDVTFDSIEARGLPENPSILKNYGRVKEYASNLSTEIKQGNGMILAGNYGTMKTTMAIAVLRKWLSTGESGIFVPMCSLIDNLFSMCGEERRVYEKHIRDTRLLILDDLGGENTDQSWILSKVDSIITERYNKMLATIVTTNLTQSGLETTYSGRILDRLKSTGYYLRFDGESERKPLQWSQIVSLNSMRKRRGKES